MITTYFKKINALILSFIFVSIVSGSAFAVEYNDFSVSIPNHYTLIQTNDKSLPTYDPDYRIYLESVKENGYTPIINITDYARTSESGFTNVADFSALLIRELPGIISNWKFVSRRDVTNKYGVKAVNIISTSNQTGDDIRHVIYLVESAKKFYMITCTNIQSNGDSQDKACIQFFKSFKPK